MKLTYWDSQAKRYKQVTAYLPFTMHGEKWVVHRSPINPDYWTVTHVTTGCCLNNITWAKTRDVALAQGRAYLERKKEREVKKAIESSLARIHADVIAAGKAGVH